MIGTYELYGSQSLNASWCVAVMAAPNNGSLGADKIQEQWQWLVDVKEERSQRRKILDMCPQWTDVARDEAEYIYVQVILKAEYSYGGATERKYRLQQGVLRESDTPRR